MACQRLAGAARVAAEATRRTFAEACQPLAARGTDFQKENQCNILAIPEGDVTITGSMLRIPYREIRSLSITYMIYFEIFFRIPSQSKNEINTSGFDSFMIHTGINKPVRVLK